MPTEQKQIPLNKTSIILPKYSTAGSLRYAEAGTFQDFLGYNFGTIYSQHRNDWIALNSGAMGRRPANFLRHNSHILLAAHENKVLGDLTPDYLAAGRISNLSEQIVLEPLHAPTAFDFKTKDSEGKEKTITIFSEFPKQVLEHFGGGINLSELPLTPTITLHNKLNSKGASRYGPHLSRYRDLVHCPVKFDQVGSFSHLKDVLSEKDFLKAASNRKVKVIELTGLYRGNNGNTTTEPTTATPKEIVKGSYVFPFIISLTILDQIAQQWKAVPFFCLGIFDSLDKTIRYVRSRSYLPKLAADLKGEDCTKVLDPEAYQRYLEETWGKHTKFWDGPQKVMSSVPKEQIKSIFKNTVYTKAETKKVTGKELAPLEKSANPKLLKKTKELEKVEKKYTKLKNELVTAEGVLAETKYIVEDNARLIENYKEAMNQIRTRIKEQEKSAVKAEKDVAGIQPSVLDLEKAVEDTRKTLQDILTPLTKEGETSKDVEKSNEFISNLAETGVVISDIVYADHKNDNKFVSINKKPEVAFLAKNNLEKFNGKNRWSLSKVCFYTTKPIIIYLDRAKYKSLDKCPKVIGGPYYVEATQGNRTNEANIYVSLTSSQACFGWKDIDQTYGTAWIHPHTQSYEVVKNDWGSFKQFLERTAHGCLGEAAPTLYHALQGNDPKLTVFAALTWLSNANTTDTWGKWANTFPKPADVHIEDRTSKKVQKAKKKSIKAKTKKPTIEDLVKTDEGMEELAEAMEEGTNSGPAETLTDTLAATLRNIGQNLQVPEVAQGGEQEAPPPAPPPPATPAAPQITITSNGTDGYSPYVSTNTTT